VVETVTVVWHKNKISTTLPEYVINLVEVINKVWLMLNGMAA
jgi:hypothetical protein